MSFLFRKVEDVTTISKSQSLTSVSIKEKDCTLRVPNETTTLFLSGVIIKAIFIQTTCVSGIGQTILDPCASCLVDFRYDDLERVVPINLRRHTRERRRISHWKWKLSFVPRTLRYPLEKSSFQFSPNFGFRGGPVG